MNRNFKKILSSLLLMVSLVAQGADEDFILSEDEAKTRVLVELKFYGVEVEDGTLQIEKLVAKPLDLTNTPQYNSVPIKKLNQVGTETRRDYYGTKVVPVYKEIQVGTTSQLAQYFLDVKFKTVSGDTGTASVTVSKLYSQPTYPLRFALSINLESVSVSGVRLQVSGDPRIREYLSRRLWEVGLDTRPEMIFKKGISWSRFEFLTDSQLRDWADGKKEQTVMVGFGDKKSITVSTKKVRPQDLCNLVLQFSRSTQD